MPRPTWFSKHPPACTCVKCNRKRMAGAPPARASQVEARTPEPHKPPTMVNEGSAQRQTAPRVKGGETGVVGEGANRNAPGWTQPFLLASVLLVGVVILGVLLWRKGQDLAETRRQLDQSVQTANDLKTRLDAAMQTNNSLQARLSQTQQNVGTLQTQLASSQQNAKSLETKLSAAVESQTAMQKKIDDLQATFDEISSPPLIPGTPVTTNFNIPGYSVVSIPIDVERFGQVQGEIHATGTSPMVAYIQDPNGAMVRDFGQIWQSNFQFKALIPGRYTVVVRNPVDVLRPYILIYTVYHR